VLAQRLIWSAGLPRPQHNYAVFNGLGFVAKVDFAWPGEKLTSRPTGSSTPSTAPATRPDQEQESELQACGWRVPQDDLARDRAAALVFIDRLRRAYQRAQSPDAMFHVVSAWRSERGRSQMAAAFFNDLDPRIGTR